MRSGERVYASYRPFRLVKINVCNSVALAVEFYQRFEFGMSTNLITINRPISTYISYHVKESVGDVDFKFNVLIK